MQDTQPTSRHRYLGYVAMSQGAFYLATGVWPLIDIRSFKYVTGEKTDNLPSGSDIDHWLVVTVALLLSVIGTVLLTSALRRQIPVESVVLGLGAAASLMAIDIFYVIRQVILPIYLLDAALQLTIILGWLSAWNIQKFRDEPKPMH